ncbi:MAG: ribbon-helix-helix protein, CopG family [Deltaproteobacteria bacterium]|nr:ribbon-helix-helix protein, CopG family [Deltaproteobacteria bacterium]
MRTVSLKLPEDLDHDLSELAKRRGETRSMLIREAIAAYTRQHRRSVTDVAEDLVGSLAGPSELSTRDLSGYGE